MIEHSMHHFVYVVSLSSRFKGALKIKRDFVTAQVQITV